MKKTIKIMNILMVVLMISMIASNIVLALDPISIRPVTDGDGVTPVRNIGQQIVGIIQVAGTIVSVGMLAVLGIKYMMGSSEEKAEYKKTLMPYAIGAILVFAAVNLASMVYRMSTQVKVS